jgi:hypothetical protein
LKEEKEEKWDGEREKLKKENESFFSSLETERKMERRIFYSYND